MTSRILNIALWIAQVLLSAVFLMAGYMKLSASMEELHAQMDWPGDLPEPLVRFIGLSEFIGAVGLLAPALTKIKTALTPWAASGLALVMLMAAIFHLMRGEYSAILVNSGFGLLSAFVAWGRFRKVRLEEKQV